MPSWMLWNTRNISGNTTRFMELMNNMMNNNIAVRAANGGSQRKFATDFVNYTSFVTIYGMGQCTPDLSPSDCNMCLESAIGEFRESRGGRILQPSCVARYEVYRIFNESLVPPRTNSSHNGEVRHITITNNFNFTVCPAISTNGDDSSRLDAPSGFVLSPGESEILNLRTDWTGSIWGRTLCSTDETGNFSCQTGDCGTGAIECQGATLKLPVTSAEFRQLDNIVLYVLSITDGYNLPMMVAPQGPQVGTGGRCTVIGCAFNLSYDTCPSMFSQINTNMTMIGCRNPCYVEECCKPQILCQSRDYWESSLLFNKSCPQAQTNRVDLSTTTFSCPSYRTSYEVTFCPSPNMTSLFLRPFGGIGAPSPTPSPFPSPSGKNQRSVTKVVVAIVVPMAVLALLIAICTCHFRRKEKKCLSLDIRKVLEDFTTAESLMFELDSLQAATNYFSNDNKLGGGGFGNVYKGTLSSGQDIAVKRLSRISDQGIESFKNEAVLIAKLQHKNLVKLIGFCITREEKLLVYELVHNKSLNYFLFDPRKQGELDWPTRYNIITGIARGLLYLHEDSRPRIIHRDLKAANILLEADMNPKIADFGLARTFKVEQTEDDTSIVAGTYGYMAPEYAMNGQFSIKSDVYSFGVLVLEIVSGKKISSRFQPSGVGDLLTFAWRCWKAETHLEFMDQTLKNSYSTDEVLRCIHLGLACVQENAQERPTMSTVVFMLNTNSTASAISNPQRPRFYHYCDSESSPASRSKPHSTTTSNSSDLLLYSRNQITISDISPR